MLRRTFNIRSMDVTGTGEDESIRIAISTETPYLRGRIAGHRAAFEVLGHKPNEVNMEHMYDGAPFLFEHKTDNQIGVLDNVQVNEDGVLRADVRFSRSQFAQEILDDIKRGIRRRISVGYEVKEYSEAGEQDGMPVVRATSWTPYEASLVSIPADLNAGVGKGLRGKRMSEDGPVFVYNDAEEVVEVLLPDGTSITDPAEVSALVEQFSMAPVEAPAEDTPEVPTEEVVPVSDAVAEVTEEVPTDPVVEAAVEVLEEAVESPTEEATEVVEEVEEDDDEAVKATSKSLVIQTDNNPAPVAAHKETSQMSKSIGSEGASKETVKELTDLAVRHNMTADLADWISEGMTVESVKAKILDARSNTDKVIGAPAIHIKKEVSIGGAVASFLRGENSELAERGIDQARNSQRSISSNTLYLPTNVDMIPTRLVRTGTGYTNTGASAVGKTYMSWEETLREGSKLAQVGGQIITLNDVGSMPYFSTPATASMFHESGSSTDSEVAVSLRSWTPKRVSARYLFQNIMTRLNGTYDFESELYTDLMAEGIRQIDAQVWNGTGTNNVTGLINDTNIASIVTTGSFDLGGASKMWANVAARNGTTDGTFAIVVATTPYADAIASGAFAAGSGESVLSQIEKSIGKVYNTNYFSKQGNYFQAVGGDFSKVTLANFGPLEIKRDEYTLSQTGQTVLQFEAYIDSVARQPGALVRWVAISA